MNLYHIKLTDDQKDALERLFNMGIVWSKTELSEAWEQLREQLKDAVQCVAIINALQDSGCECKKTSKPAPKYDPSRKFRKGDIVRPRERDGREPWGRTLTSVRCLNKSRTLNVRENEARGIVKCEDGDGIGFDISPFFLELITPVEALEPYFVGESENSYDLFRKTSNGNQLRASFWWKHNPTPDLIELSKANAKAAAEAERDRLNAEHRKEKK